MTEKKSLTDKLIFRPALQSDAPEILALYKSLVGTPFCAWDDSYPSKETLADDLENQAIYCLTLDEKLIAAGTIRHCPEHDELCTWKTKNPCDLMRIGVNLEMQGRGTGSFLLQKLIQTSIRSGYDGMRILVAQTNLPAVRVYQKAGAAYRGTAFSYDIHWFCYEII